MFVRISSPLLVMSRNSSFLITSFCASPKASLFVYSSTWIVCLLCSATIPGTYNAQQCCICKSDHNGPARTSARCLWVDTCKLRSLSQQIARKAFVFKLFNTPNHTPHFGACATRICQTRSDRLDQSRPHYRGMQTRTLYARLLSFFF